MDTQIVCKVADRFVLADGTEILKYLCAKYKIEGVYEETEKGIFAVFKGKHNRTMTLEIDEAYRLYRAMAMVDEYFSCFITGSNEHWSDFRENVNEMLQDLDGEYDWRIALNYL